jgi:hypothetical protein
VSRKAAKGKNRPKRIGQCVYCGAVGPVTDDHVPPRSFYPKSPPPNLITVPCCEKCNVKFGKEDDYVRLVLTTTEGATGNPARDESKRILASFYKTLSSGYFPGPAGIHIRREHFVVDGERMDSFARRVVRALFYREKGHRLPGGYAINALHHRRMNDVIRQSGDNADFWLFIIDKLNEPAAHKAWGEVLGYSLVQSPNDLDATWWLLHFYGTPQYLCSTFNETAASTLIVGGR